MRHLATLTFAALLATAALADNARAEAAYVNYLPNGTVKNCLNCHPNNITTQTNAFGQAASNQVAKPTTEWWPNLRDLDSDGDGQTNGQEMGDPCGEWLIGLDPPRTTAISNPGDPGEQSADPDSPACEGGGGAGPGPGTGGAGGATGAGATGAGDPGGDGAGDPGSNPVKSTGAGKADPPIAVAGSCATNPTTPGAAWDIGLIAGALMLLVRLRRKRT